MYTYYVYYIYVYDNVYVHFEYMIRFPRISLLCVTLPYFFPMLHPGLPWFFGEEWTTPFPPCPGGRTTIDFASWPHQYVFNPVESISL